MNKMSVLKNVSESLINSYENIKKKIIVIYDEHGEVDVFNEDNLLDRVKKMEVESYDFISEKLLILKVKGMIIRWQK